MATKATPIRLANLPSMSTTQTSTQDTANPFTFNFHQKFISKARSQPRWMRRTKSTARTRRGRAEVNDSVSVAASATPGTRTSLGSTDTLFGYDQYGNIASLKKTMADGKTNTLETDSVVNTYNYNTSSWLIAQPNKTTTTSTAPSGFADDGGGARRHCYDAGAADRLPQRRVVQYGEDANGSVNSIEIQPGGRCDDAPLAHYLLRCARPPCSALSTRHQAENGPQHRLRAGWR